MAGIILPLDDCTVPPTEVDDNVRVGAGGGANPFNTSLIKSIDVPIGVFDVQSVNNPSANVPL